MYAEQLWQLCEGLVSEGPRVLMLCKQDPNEAVESMIRGVITIWPA